MSDDESFFCSPKPAREKFALRVNTIYTCDLFPRTRLCARGLMYVDKSATRMYDLLCFPRVSVLDSRRDSTPAFIKQTCERHIRSSHYFSLWLSPTHTHRLRSIPFDFFHISPSFAAPALFQLSELTANAAAERSSDR